MLSEQGRFVIKCEYTIDSHLLKAAESGREKENIEYRTRNFE